jgi:ATP-binding cassette subfamily B protein
MIAALREPTSGAVRWNGRPLPDWDPDSLRSRIAVVTQEYFKWPFTAATNIAIGDPDAAPQQDRIETAARLAVAHDMIRELPHGYDTLLDRTFADGQDLSGGQWQRITAARMLTELVSVTSALSRFFGGRWSFVQLWPGRGGSVAVMAG